MGFKRMKYTSKFKLQVVMLALKTNNSEAGRQFSVNEKLVRDWRKKEAELRNMPPTKCSNRGKKSTDKIDMSCVHFFTGEFILPNY